jgi:hypothetical protein
MLCHLFVRVAIAALLIGGSGCGGASSKYAAPTWDGDRDHDGVLDAKDDCPDKGEDFDGFKDTDGCADTDNDSDGIDDVEDDCPSVKGESPSGCPGIADAVALAKTQPEDLDKDGDGLPVPQDKCPDAAEDFDGWGDTDGCPEDDFDGDTINDSVDKCPGQKEDGLGPNPNDGCPMNDEDRDGVPDETDHCRTIAGLDYNRGCPACVAAWNGEAAISIGSTSSTCGSVTIKSGNMTCAGRLTSCDLGRTSFRGSFSCTYDKVAQTVSGSINGTCDATNGTFSVSTGGNTLSWKLRK